jgi:hypothetical protein
MVPYMSFWFGSREYCDLNHLILMHKISCYFIKQHYGVCHLLTDSYGANAFRDCGFTSISTLTSLDNLSPIYKEHPNIARLYGIQEAVNRGVPFIHLDYDVFLWNKIPNHFEYSKLFVQDIVNESYPETFLFLTQCPYHTLNNASSVNFLPNIIGGTDLTSLDSFSKECLNIILNNNNKSFFQTKWSKEEAQNNTSKTSILQYQILSKIRYEGNIPIENISNPDTIYYKQGFTHFFDAKHHIFWKNQIKRFTEKLAIC